MISVEQDPRSRNESTDADALTSQENVIIPVSSHEETVGLRVFPEVPIVNENIPQNFAIPQLNLIEREELYTF